LSNRCDTCTETGFTREPGCKYEVTDDERIMKNSETWQYTVKNFKECISLCAADVNCVSVGFFGGDKCRLKSSNAIQICTEAVSENSTSGSRCSADNECKQVVVTASTTSTTIKTTLTTASTTSTSTSNSSFFLLLKVSIIYHFQADLL
jgi:hypothetical protein